MGTGDDEGLSMQSRAVAAGGAALVAACIVNPLDVIKTRIQAQAMAESLGQVTGAAGCTTPWTCTSTLYDSAARHGLQLNHGVEMHHQHQPATPAAAAEHARRLLLRHSHSLHAGSGSAALLRPAQAAPGAAAAAAAAAAAMSAVRSAAADRAAAAAAAFRRWGITEGPRLPVRRTPPSPVPPGWMPSPVPAAVRPPAAAAAAAAAAVRGAACVCAPQSPSAASAASAAATLPGAGQSMWEVAKAISRQEGLPMLWRGTWASLLIAVPMVGIYMPLYDTLLASWASHAGSLAPVAAGTAARTAACFCVAPFELLRTRLQASAASGASLRSTVSSLVAEQHQHHHQPQQHSATSSGGRQLQLQQAQQQQQPLARAGAVLRAVPRMWTGFSATLVRDVPFSALYWALVEPLRQAMLPLNSHWPPLERLAAVGERYEYHYRRQQPPQQQQQHSGDAGAGVLQQQQQHSHHSQLEILIANMLSGCIAGGLAAAATTPFDVVKTRMQIATPSQQQQQLARAAASSARSSGGGSGGGMRVFAILADVYRKEGLEGLFAGVKPRAYRAAPACGIVISVYELLKSYLTPA